ncbi:hypothetical protein Tco_0916369 [Tanacetum coccineum]
MSVWDYGISKSPGPDGFTFEFYRKYWSLIDHDVVAAVTSFFSTEGISEEDVAENNAENNGYKYMSKTRADYGSGIARPKIEDKDSFELKCQFLKELRTNTFSGSDHEDANEHIEKDLEIVDLLHIPNITIDQEVVLFYNGLDVPTGKILDSRGAIPSKTAADAKTRSTETSDGLTAIQAQLNNLGREIKKVNEKVYAAQVGCEQCKGTYYTKDCPLKEERKTLEEAYYTQFGAPFQGGGYRVIALGFHQRNNVNPSTQLIKEIRASTDAAIRNQGASIKTLEIQIGQMSKVLQERGFGSLPSSTKTNPRDHVKSISTIVEADLYLIRQKKGSYGPQFSEAYSKASHINNSIPKKEKDLGSFTLPCFINNVCFDNALADLGASVVEEFRARNDARMDKLEYKGNNVVGTLMNIPIFVETFSILTDSTVLEDMDAYHDEGMGDVIFGEPFLREVRINAKQFEGMITIHNGNEEVTYHMTRSHPRTSLKEKEIDNVGGESMIWKSRSVGVLKPNRRKMGNTVVRSVVALACGFGSTGYIGWCRLGVTGVRGHEEGGGLGVAVTFTCGVGRGEDAEPLGVNECRVVWRSVTVYGAIPSFNPAIYALSACCLFGFITFGRTLVCTVSSYVCAAGCCGTLGV